MQQVQNGVVQAAQEEADAYRDGETRPLATPWLQPIPNLSESTRTARWVGTWARCDALA